MLAIILNSHERDNEQMQAQNKWIIKNFLLNSTRTIKIETLKQSWEKLARVCTLYANLCPKF